MRAVQETVVEHYRVTAANAHGLLSGSITKRGMPERNIGFLSVRFGQAPMKRNAPAMRPRKDSQRARIFGHITQIDQKRDLCCLSTETNGMVPAPPVLVPPERRRTRLLHAYIGRDPAQ